MPLWHRNTSHASRKLVRRSVGTLDSYADSDCCLKAFPLLARVGSDRFRQECLGVLMLESKRTVSLDSEFRIVGHRSAVRRMSLAPNPQLNAVSPPLATRNDGLRPRPEAPGRIVSCLRISDTVQPTRIASRGHCPLGLHSRSAIARGTDLVPPFSRHPTEENHGSYGLSACIHENRVDSSLTATCHLTEPGFGNTIMYPR